MHENIVDNTMKVIKAALSKNINISRRYFILEISRWKVNLTFIFLLWVIILHKPWYVAVEFFTAWKLTYNFYAFSIRTARKLHKVLAEFFMVSIWKMGDKI